MKYKDELKYTAHQMRLGNLTGLIMEGCKVAAQHGEVGKKFEFSIIHLSEIAGSFYKDKLKYIYPDIEQQVKLEGVLIDLVEDLRKEFEDLNIQYRVEKYKYSKTRPEISGIELTIDWI